MTLGNPEYRAHLSEEQRAELPESPSGWSISELGKEDLADVHGGRPRFEMTEHPRCNTGPVRCTRGTFGGEW
ncbi:mersacidin/lichenicidin family type 2 lantibiotic [Archangium lansingense]|uniref:mersacidin/lichenicidin family type 2 lantibiotic n=1 Tax=Archangium lansingense TaxID=2995310 RepID=UPI00358DBD87